MKERVNMVMGRKPEDEATNQPCTVNREYAMKTCSM